MIPKFSSFRPKSPLPVHSKPAPTENEKVGLSSRSTYRDDQHRQKRRRSASPLASQGAGRRLESTSANKGSGDPAFIIDRKGDVQNAIYGGADSRRVPRFYRVGAGNVLGGSRKVKIDRDIENGIVLINREQYPARQREKYVFARNEKRKARLVRIQTDDSESGHDENFLPFPISKSKRREGEYADSDSDEHYRSIKGKAKPSNQPADKDLYYTSAESGDSEKGIRNGYNEDIKAKSIELSRRVDEHPGEVQAWLKLIEHQDDLLLSHSHGRRKTTLAEKASTAEIKLHLYEKALEKAGRTLEIRELLLPGMMAEGSKVWSTEVQSQRWEDVGKSSPESAELWIAFMNFRQTEFGLYQYQEIKDIGLDRLCYLKDAILKNGLSDNIVEQWCHVVLRTTLAMREAGYVEIATAIWQALIEYNLQAPAEFTKGMSRMKSFQDFWESESLRIGEDGALGWHSYVTNEDDSIIPEARVDQNSPVSCLKKVDMFHGWAMAERFQQAQSKEPARTLDDVAEDDPYRVILWSDIEEYVVDLELNQHPTRKSLFLECFLSFCRLPTMLPTSNDAIPPPFIADPFIQEAYLDTSHSFVFQETLSIVELSIDMALPNESSLANAPQEIKKPLQCAQGFVNSIDTFFSGCPWASSFQQWQLSYEGDSDDSGEGWSFEPVRYHWLLDVMDTLVGKEYQKNKKASAPTDDAFAEFYLAFQWANNPKDIKKIAKNLLKQRPQSLRLYNAYAMIEDSRGNHESAVKITAAALGMKGVLPPWEEKNCILLWRTQVWLYLDKADKMTALLSLLRTCPDLGSLDMDATSPATLLKVKQHLQSARDHLLTSRELRFAVVWAECLAMLEYLSPMNEHASTCQGDLASALRSVEDFSQTLRDRGFAQSAHHEQFYQAASRLLYYHMRSGPFQPATVRSFLARALDLFPTNTMLLSLYAWNERGLRTHSRVRSLLRDKILTPANDNIASRIFAVRHEIRYGNVHTAYAAFDSAVEGHVCRSSPGFWRLYVLFCVSTREYRDRAKDVLYRAIKACPWAKALLMLGFAELRDLLSFEEKRALYRILGEKNLRIHVDLEERLEEHEESEKRGDQRR